MKTLADIAASTRLSLNTIEGMLETFVVEFAASRSLPFSIDDVVEALDGYYSTWTLILGREVELGNLAWEHTGFGPKLVVVRD